MGAAELNFDGESYRTTGDGGRHEDIGLSPRHPALGRSLGVDAVLDPYGLGTIGRCEHRGDTLLHLKMRAALGDDGVAAALLLLGADRLTAVPRAVGLAVVMGEVIGDPGATAELNRGSTARTTETVPLRSDAAVRLDAKGRSVGCIHGEEGGDVEKRPRGSIEDNGDTTTQRRTTGLQGLLGFTVRICHDHQPLR